MSLRKGIYKSQFSATASATPVSDGKTSWRYSLVNPATISNSEEQPSSSISTPQPEEIPEKFMVREWVSTLIPEGGAENILASFKDCEDDDKDAVINLDNYTYIPIQKDAPAAGSGLTESDIKSAVGGTGNAGSALFSSSAAHAITKDEEAAKEAQEAKESLASASAAESEAPVDTPVETPIKDSEGDVAME